MANYFSALKKFPRTFWVANSMELFERWAYYGVFAVFAIYLTDPIAEGGLGFSPQQKGMLMGIGTAILYLFPIIGGAFADKIGYKKTLIIAFSMLSVGYFFLGQFSSYSAMFATFLFVALGAALFKPIIVSTVSKVTTSETSTIGFGLFYMIVNIGAFIGPYVASRLRDNDWSMVFIVSAAMIAFNFIPLFLLYKEPTTKIKSEESFSESLKIIVKNAIMVVADFKFVLILILMGGFWTMYMQLFFSLPNYIKEWVDTSVLYNSSDFIATYFGTIEDGKGLVRPELMENLAAFFIILFQFIVSSLIMKIKPIRSITIGVGIAAVGMACMGWSSNGWFMVAAILIFAFGEMSASPRAQEYVSQIAPKDKTALYMGYSFLSIAIGNFFAGIVSGKVYGTFADKDFLLRKELVARNLMESSQAAQLAGKQLMAEASTRLNLNSNAVTELLRSIYHPEKIWLLYGSIGFATMVLIYLYDVLLMKPRRKAA